MQLIKLKHFFEDVQLCKKREVLIDLRPHEPNELVESRVPENLQLILHVVKLDLRFGCNFHLLLCQLSKYLLLDL